MNAASAWLGLLLGASLGPGLTACAVAETPASSAEQNYMLRCQGCHGAEGRGVAHKVPSLRDSVGKLVLTDDGRDFLMRVPGAANSPLSDAQLADVLNWLVLRFGGAALPKPAPGFTAADVTAARRLPLVGVHRARLEIAARLTAAGLTPPQDY